MMIPEQAQHFLDAILQSLPDVFVFCFDHDLRYVDLLGGGLARAGLTREQIVGKTLAEVMPPVVVQTVEAGYRAALENGASNRYDLPFDGGTYEVSTIPVRDGAGQVIGGAAIVRDVTLQRQVSGQMRRFETIVENAADAVMVYDLEGMIAYANPAAAALHRMEKPAELIGRHGAWALAPDVAEEVTAETTEAMRQAGVWRGRVWNQLPDGSRLLIDAVSFMLFDERNQPTGTATMARDVTSQAIEEDRRTEQQQQIIVGQQAALRELSTPLIPLADSIVVMPIIGTIDAQRAQQIMETLLEGIAANQAEIALLDISGVRVVDTQVADALLRAAKAANLLGTRIVLTGIKAEVAQTIVHLGADMREIVTRANLQEGLRYALDTVGETMGRKV